MNTHTYPKATDKWLDDFTLALRARGADGPTTGDALATIEQHLADSGETPMDAFGDPVDYAKALTLPHRDSPLTLLAAAIPALLLVLGWQLIPAAVNAMKRHNALHIPFFAVGLATLVLVAVIALIAFSDRILRSRSYTYGFIALTAIASGAAFALPDRTALSLPAVPALIGGITALIVGTIWHLTHRTDPIVRPGQPRHRALDWGMPLIFIGLTAVQTLLIR